ncbi:hypothetical protein TVAG_227120 [Trichomonas vaginalis G3]|uniref:Uncharacterized protein n=1 Tax=Trichomonas vaginalis (strain ATCC PRA-98 / G3) TaxID=412133 RepID=A2FFV6_TRIV3|nr:hypothetical protein TVAGG3_0803090 [Trichomonas vaginalis G3]EAX96217.1 hypothetical protein TVAG_227120 [Trichomonas vaginalis G3]KAI5496650.1 hypothetical protein TVAGG3_0803090 [Trichomonas vaginalis G3]|eukprot:XP_001309147.1 hypothetical protein [Trichomonas vaginalis G3]
MSQQQHFEHDCTAAAHKINALHAAQVDETSHPHEHVHGVDPLHQDHSEHIQHKQVAHGHHTGSAAAPAKDGAAPAKDAAPAPKK